MRTPAALLYILLLAPFLRLSRLDLAYTFADDARAVGDAGSGVAASAVAAARRRFGNLAGPFFYFPMSLSPLDVPMQRARLLVHGGLRRIYCSIFVGFELLYKW